MAWTKQDQMAYIAKRRAEGTIIRVTVDVTQDTANDWQSYADAIGMKRATMIRECVRRCMELDGWTQHGADRNETSGSESEHIEPTAPGADNVEPVKCKRGRPRKVQTADAGGMVSDASGQDNADNTDATTPPRRKRGRPRKVSPV